MTQNEQTLPNAQDFIAAFTSCNMAAQKVSEQLLKEILLDTTHNMVHLVKLLTLQFDNLFKQIQELQVRIETINKAQQEPQQHRTQNSMAVENQFNTSQNLYDIIGAQLKENVKDIKNVIHRNIVAEDPEQDVKYAQLLDNNKVNNKILHTLCMAYKFRLFIFNGRTKQKSQYGENDEKIIRIFHIKNKYSLFKKQNDRIKQKKNHASNSQKYHKQNSYKGNNYMNSGKDFRQQSLINTIKQVVKEVIVEKGNQPNWKQQQQQFSQDPQVYDQEEIFCQKCGSSPYASAQSYRSHIHFKHDGKTPSKNKFHKNLRFNGN